MFDHNVMFETCPTDQAWFATLFYTGLFAIGVLIDAGVGIRLFLKPMRWDLAIDAVRRRPWSPQDGGIMLLALLNLQLMLYVLSFAFADASPFLWLVLNSIMFHGAGLVMILWFLRARGLTWKSAFGLERRGVVRHACRGVFLYLIILPVFLFSAVAYQVFLLLMHFPSSAQPVAEMLTETDSLAMRVFIMVLAVGIAPVVEELFFRGIGLPLLARRWGIGPAVFGVSLVFALLHFHVPSLVPLFVISVGLSLAYIHSGSIAVPIVIHSIFNAVNLGLLTFMQ